MGAFQLSSLALYSSSVSLNFNYITNTQKTPKKTYYKPLSFSRTRGGKIRAITTIPDSESEDIEADGPPSVDFAFFSSSLLPDGTPDVLLRRACGGQKLRDIMLEANIDLYGPYVIEGKELLSPRTDKEKEKLKRKPKNWRLACQTKVGEPDSRGLVVVQQLPEWKSHEWSYEEIDPSEPL
ncbi:photosynthetic NDH subunit of subcomplex B 3, chloroplastic isoform X2 [Morus notabilis]|uniref:photosynthetic NDH subunit of subcomplex B 3, chloroplastic isoform X2 n=1 Tax=Morus notabilis TaxID=981085 RepID=UPI000CED1D33|nr:photosynthetic NDH subunit of subcomplex B 3, chloroplastic isoform X2 [Morus notabilis]